MKVRAEAACPSLTCLVFPPESPVIPASDLPWLCCGMRVPVCVGVGGGDSCKLGPGLWNLLFQVQNWSGEGQCSTGVKLRLDVRSVPCLVPWRS